MHFILAHPKRLGEQWREVRRGNTKKLLEVLVSLFKRKTRRLWAALDLVCQGLYKLCPKVPSHVLWKIETVIEKDVGQWRLSSLQSRHLGTSHSSPSRHQLLRHISLNLINDLKSLPFQRWFKFWEKPGVIGGWVTWVIWCFPKKHWTRPDSWASTLLWWSCQSPVAHSCGLLNHLNSFCGGMFKLNAKFEADVLLYLLSHFECDGHTGHMLTLQGLPPPLTSVGKLSLFTHAHSSLLSLAARLYRCRTNVLIILTMADLFLDRPHTKSN